MGYKGKLFSETTCAKCGWIFGTIYHICLDITDPNHTKVIHGGRVGRQAGFKMPARSQEYRDAMSAAQYERWEKEREKNAKRDARIRRLYETGEWSIHKLCLEFKLGKRACRTAIENAGGVIRQPGRNVRWTQKESA